MTTRETLEGQLKDAIRAKDEVRKRTLRMVLSAIKLAEVEKREAIDENSILAVLQKEVKNRKESIAEAEKAGRADLAADTQAEIEILNTYLPQPLSPQEVEEIIRQAISESGSATPSEMGKVMKLVTPKTQGRADNREVSQLVRKLLGG
jgi:uncharacterized protein YqeY